jgi:hypothetical protein
MAMKPNWFDTEFEKTMEKATAEEALAQVAKSPRIIQAVKDALANRGKIGPTRTQAIRSAIAHTLQAD